MFDTNIDISKAFGLIAAALSTNTPPRRLQTKSGAVYYIRPSNVLRFYDAFGTATNTKFEFVDGTSYSITGISPDEVAAAFEIPKPQAA